MNAMINECWAGFFCSLDDPASKSRVLDCLKKSAEDTYTFLNDTERNETRVDFLISLYEHEIQHHGQLIRFVYGNKLGFPKSWNERYTV